MVFYISGPKLLFETTEISTHPNSTLTGVKLYIFIHNTVRDFDKISTQPEIRVNRVRDNNSQLYIMTNIDTQETDYSVYKDLWSSYNPDINKSNSNA